ncbi:signal peptidase II [Candidatus Woesearchaeota archaeon]|nr:signal peptidase II [Candidatus Woesearchaeota archaeon]
MNLKNKKSTEKNKALIILLTSVAVVLLDQLTKFSVVRNLQLFQSVPIIQNIFHLTYIQNTGAGFGLFQQSTSLLIWFSIIVIGLILYFYDAVPNDKCVQIATALILGGTLGNLIDRINLGYVIDFLDFRIWPAFNIADIAITLGVIRLIIYMIKTNMKK